MSEEQLVPFTRFMLNQHCVRIAIRENGQMVLIAPSSIMNDGSLICVEENEFQKVGYEQEK